MRIEIEESTHPCCPLHHVRMYLRLKDPKDLMTFGLTCEQCEFEKTHSRWGEGAEL